MQLARIPGVVRRLLSNPDGRLPMQLWQKLFMIALPFLVFALAAILTAVTRALRRRSRGRTTLGRAAEPSRPAQNTGP